MTFQQLMYVSEVAHLGSINKAAQTLYVSQSTISNSIKDLETELNMQIFQRSSVGIQLTSSGREFLNYARSLLDQKRQIERVFKSSDIKYYARLSVVSQHLAFPVSALIRLLEDLDNDNYELSLKETSVDNALEDVCAGRSDIGILFASGIMQHYMEELLASKELEFYEICRLTPHICVRNGHPLAAYDRVTKADLAPFPYLGIHQEFTTPFDHTEEVRLFTQHKPDRTIYVTDRSSIYDIILNTDAYQFSSGMRSPLERSMTKAIPLYEKLAKMRFGWVKLKHKNLTSIAQRFIDLLSKEAIRWSMESSAAFPEIEISE